jgi:hypothetical protein
MGSRRMTNWQKLVSLLKPRRAGVRWILYFLLGTAFFFLLASSVLVYADARHKGEMFPNTVILGVDVTGMTREEAIEAVTREAVEPLMQPVILQFKGRQWSINPLEMGLHVDVEALVDQAYREGWERSFLERAYRRAFNRPLDISLGLEYTLDRDAIMRKLEAVAAEIDQEVRNASLDFDFQTGKLTFIPSREGYWMDVEATLGVVEQGLLSENRVVEPVVRVTQPSLSSDDVQTVLVVDIMGCTLKWYNKDQLVKTYYVATGQPKYPTPLGKYYIIRKEENPVWINPGSEWAEDMPPRIEPGPDNPLGLRALVTSAAGGTVLIHGTSNLVPGLYSHGCIRMANWAIVELFDHVEVGTPLFIWTSKPIPPPPPEEGTPEGPQDPGLGSGEESNGEQSQDAPSQ